MRPASCAQRTARIDAQASFLQRLMASGARITNEHSQVRNMRAEPPLEQVPHNMISDAD